MSSKAKRAFRPWAEPVEERCVATAHALAAGFEVQALAAHRRGDFAAVRAARVAHRHAGPRVAPGAGANGGIGLIRLGLPGSFLDYGVVTLWNNTTTAVTFTVSASTYRNGQFFPFRLLPGQHQSFFAPVVNGQTPLFRVSFRLNSAGAIPLPYENIVFESPGYRPQGTAGWPYAINLGPNGYVLRSI